MVNIFNSKMEERTKFSFVRILWQITYHKYTQGPVMKDQFPETKLLNYKRTLELIKV